MTFTKLLTHFLYFYKVKQKLIIIGGGAAGFFAAANLSEHLDKVDVTILEATKELMKKIKISGGGRCNVTHACFEPDILASNYPRGERELLSPFHKYACGDTFDWFQKRGVALKIEEDGRTFPETDSSQTIIDCLYKNSIDQGVKLKINSRVDKIEIIANNSFVVHTNDGKTLANHIILATGSNLHIWKMISEMGLKTINPVPSLFTFNTKDSRLRDLSGISFPKVSIEVEGTKLKAEGPMLITHVGLSGPAILRMSAWGAFEFAKAEYKCTIKINFTEYTFKEVMEHLQNMKQSHTKKFISNTPLFGISKRYWASILNHIQVGNEMNWSDISKEKMTRLTDELTGAKYPITGKSTYKDEFVTAGGVALEEIDFKTYQSKKHKGLYFAGEVLNIDGITGGFNFQNAWTGSWLAVQDIVRGL
jgi:predicted Rossmann fold flavoprotein